MKHETRLELPEDSLDGQERKHLTRLETLADLPDPLVVPSHERGLLGLGVARRKGALPEAGADPLDGVRSSLLDGEGQHAQALAEDRAGRRGLDVAVAADVEDDRGESEDASREEEGHVEACSDVVGSA